MKNFYALLFLLSFSCIGFSQDVIQQETPENKSFLKEANSIPAEGTYQVVVTNKDVIVDLTEAILRQIVTQRHAENVTYITVNDYVKVRVLPFNIIRNKEFVPIKKYSYEN